MLERCALQRLALVLLLLLVLSVLACARPKSIVPQDEGTPSGKGQEPPALVGALEADPVLPDLAFPASRPLDLEGLELYALAASFEAVPVLSNLEFPVSWANAPDGTLYFTEGYTGRVRAVVGWRVLERPVIELSDALGSWEQGMLGLAAHPNFSEEPFLYLYYTATKKVEGGQQVLNRVIRFRVQQATARQAEVLLDDLPADTYHNGGILLFGPDGKLYVSVGDGHESESAQKPSSLAGKVLRLNPDGTVPEDNPFPGSPVYAMGFRNVFGMAFDPVSGRLFVTENGPDCCDELNLVRPGHNYGWPQALGRSAGGEFADPLLVFTTSIAPTQATFYSGGQLLPSGDLLFGDYLWGNLHRVVLGGTERDKVILHEIIYDAHAPIIGLFLGADGEVYFSTPTDLYRLVPQPRQG